jgi:hypothetical protein
VPPGKQLLAARTAAASPSAVAVAPSKRTLDLPHVLLGVIVAAAGATRLTYLLSDRMGFNGDEAATGIMVRDILHGRMYAFFAGQHYGGTLEQYLQAAMYLVLRLPQNALTLRLPQVALSMATCYLVHQCALLMLGSRRPALVAAGLFAICPWFNLLMGATSLGFYVAGATLGVGALYCALRFEDGPRWRVAFGLCCGLAVWTSLTAAYAIVPALVWVAPAVIRRVAPVGAAVAGLLVGAAPVFYLVLVEHKLPVPPTPGVYTSLRERFDGLRGPVLREFLGISYWQDRGGAPHAVQALVVALLVGGFLVAAFRHRASVWAAATFRLDGRRPADLLLLAPVVVIVLYLASPSVWYTSTPRYLFSAYPLLAISVAALLPRRYPRVFTGTAVAVGIAAALLCGEFFAHLRIVPHTATRDADLRRVITTLQARHERAVYADYWTAMPMQYLAGGRLDVSPCIGEGRFARIDRRVRAAAHPVYVGNTFDRTATRISTALRTHHVGFRTTRIGMYEIYDQIEPTAHPPALELF